VTSEPAGAAQQAPTGPAAQVDEVPDRQAVDRVSYRLLFGSVEFRAIFGAHVASMLGDVIAAVAVTVLVYQKSGSPALAALSFSLTFLPHLFGGPIVSLIVDRFRSRPVLVVCNLACALLVGVLTLPGLPVWLILAVMFVVGLVAPVFAGVRAASLPDVLGEGSLYVLGRGMIRIVSQASFLVGYGAGGLLLGFVSPRAALGLDALSFIVAAVLLQFWTVARSLARTAADGAERAGSFRDVLRGRHTRALLIVGWLAPSCAISAEGLAAPYVSGLGLPAHDLGLMLTAGPLGMVLIDLVVSRAASPRLRRRLIAPGALLMCLPNLAFAANPALPVAMLVLFVSGLGLAYNPGLDAALVACTPAHLVPKTLAYQHLLLLGIQGVAVTAWGLLAEIMPARQVIAVACAVGSVLLLVVFRDLPPVDSEAGAGQAVTVSG
jgi:Na+/melibiose symporter-like transporter